MAKGKKEFTDNEIARMGILWVLLNSTTEYKADSNKVVEVMNMIDKACPEARRMWRGNFQLVVDGKVIYDWKSK